MGDESNRAETLQFWIDAQLPPTLAQWLQRAHGTEARHVEDLGLHRAEDTKIFTEARATDCPVVVVTKDDDFSKLLGQHGPPPQVVWVRCGNITNRELRRIMIETWANAVALLAAGEALVEIRRRSDGAS